MPFICRTNIKNEAGINKQYLITDTKKTTYIQECGQD